MVQKEYIRLLHYWEGKPVSEALLDSEPPKYNRKAPVVHPVLREFIPVINAWLEDDEKRPIKQRHTAKRICDRLCEPPYNFTGGRNKGRKHSFTPPLR